MNDQTVDRWLFEHYRTLVADLTTTLDMETGLCEATIPRLYRDLVVDVGEALDVDAGLAAIIPAAPEPPPATDRSEVTAAITSTDPGSRLILHTHPAAGDSSIDHPSAKRLSPMPAPTPSGGRYSCNAKSAAQLLVTLALFILITIESSTWMEPPPPQETTQSASNFILPRSEVVPELSTPIVPPELIGSWYEGSPQYNYDDQELAVVFTTDGKYSMFDKEFFAGPWLHKTMALQQLAARNRTDCADHSIRRRRHAVVEQARGEGS